MNRLLERLPEFFDATLLTLELTFFSSLIGFIMAVPLSILALSRNPFIRFPIESFSFIFRGTPLLIQLYVIYRCGPLVRDISWLSWSWEYLREPKWCALIAFSLNTCAYTLEIFKGSLKNTSKGEIEAGIAFGMSKFTLFRRIIFPSGFRRALPVYSNEVIFMLHGTAQAYVVTLFDILGVARNIAQETLTLTPYYIAAGLYLSITFVMVAIFRFCERRWLAYLKP